MIISRTPFRISFAGGGTDFPEFFSREDGAVTSSAIDKYMHVMVNRRFDDTIRVSYTKTEIVEEIEAIQHPIVRECLNLLDVREGLEIVSVADIPAQAGLGSSSSFTVGLLNALHAFRGEHASAGRLAEEACHVEMDLVGEPIGKQDQYIAAFGGLRHIAFCRSGEVSVEPIICGRDLRQSLSERLLLFFTGKTRPASVILSEQRRVTPGKTDVLRRLRDLAVLARNVLIEGRDLRTFGEILHEGWVVKRGIVDGITNEEIDGLYDRAREAGAIGGKLLGAGGGGFLMLYVEPEAQPRVRAALAGTREVSFKLDPHGSRIIFVDE